MELLNNWINGVNDILWSYILIIMLLGCAVWFTIKSRFVQFRMIGEMIRLLGDSAGKGEKGEKHISSFQAFAVSLASRVGTGNLAGVATAVRQSQRLSKSIRQIIPPSIVTPNHVAYSKRDRQ